MITVVVPIYNERENIWPLLKEIDKAAETIPISEIIYVDDNSNDDSLGVLKELRANFPALRILNHSNNSGQSAALWTGIKASGNDIIVTLDGDGQNNPADIALLNNTYQKYQNKLLKCMVVGERIKRNDSRVKRISSRIANYIRRSLLADQTHDTGCSLKMFKRSDYLNLPYFNHMHRFLPALMMRDGVHILHVGVSHRPRTMGVSKYGTLDRLFAGIYDLLGVLWLQKRACLEFDVHEEIEIDKPIEVERVY